MSDSTETKPAPTFKEILDKASASAVRGGTAGACAMFLNVGALMWMRTTVRLDIISLVVVERDTIDLDGPSTLRVDDNVE